MQNMRTNAYTPFITLTYISADVETAGGAKRIGAARAIRPDNRTRTRRSGRLRPLNTIPADCMTDPHVLLSGNGLLPRYRFSVPARIP